MDKLDKEDKTKNKETPEAADRRLRNGERSINRPNSVRAKQHIDKIKEILEKERSNENSSDKNANISSLSYNM